MTSPVNPPNLPSNPLNLYASYVSAVQSALAVSRTNPAITYYIQLNAPTELHPDGEYKITTLPDITSAHAFVAGEMIPL